ncbi:amidohydrolase family protein [Mucilaginibacter hurinus]|uniref:Amidohydrolase family protein n=1 Tax=Mucilaginibacter hurinus TaxID=2201324 RepID=A0A367GLC8_9SPHI|nr:amidohydrolase family protein [Mucilaginibacter hurinus]RCH54292.1 amidohydrolase family protein [Mucilaginibacter hurinus]
MKKITCLFALIFIVAHVVTAQNKTKNYTLFKPDRVFDGHKIHTGWWVLVKGNHIEATGEPASINIPAQVNIVDLKGTTLLPGLIEAHSHLFLHPYNETTWEAQLLTESRAERTARAVNHAREALMAGFTGTRDLGTEGCMYDDVGIKTAIDKGIIPGPRMLTSTRAIVATGSYQPKSKVDGAVLPHGAEEADGVQGIVHAVRSQIGHGADVVKIYVDYDFGWGVNDEGFPTFTLTELKAAVEAAHNSGRQVVAHSVTAQGMRNAIEAGVNTIEHGDGGTPELLKLMKEKGIALCATLAANEAYAVYDGWKKGVDPTTEAIVRKQEMFANALRAGVTILMGGDSGVFSHGDNAREMLLMADYGMKPLDILRSATSVNALVLKLTKVGMLKPGYLADIVAVEGNPVDDLQALKKVKVVMKDGVFYKK